MEWEIDTGTYKNIILQLKSIRYKLANLQNAYDPEAVSRANLLFFIHNIL